MHRLRESSRVGRLIRVELLPELLSPWLSPYDPGGLVRELRREAGPDHPLYSKPAKALAVAKDRDDVLFEIGEGTSLRYAVVHLTWSRKEEKSANCPFAQFFDSLSLWIEWMKADHGDYTYGEDDEKAL